MVLQRADVAHERGVVVQWHGPLPELVVSVWMEDFVGFELNPLLVEVVVTLVAGMHPTRRVNRAGLGRPRVNH